VLGSERVHFSVDLVVRPRHCDAQGMLHAARYYEYFEEAFLQWLPAVGLPYDELVATGVDLVIVESRCTHRRPVGLNDTVTITVTPVHVGGRSLGIQLDVSVGSELAATGHITYVAVHDGRPTPLPQALGSLATG
jgi:YbgC/YbaW family acyl-CoA thioester hydrolase